MGMPSPFEIGRGIGNNISGAFQKQRDTSAIDEILEHVEQNGSEGDKIIGKLLARVSPERQALALQIIQQQQAKRKQQKENEAYQKVGIDPNLPEAAKAALIKKGTEKNPFQQQQSKNEANEINEYPSKFQQYNETLNDLKQMRELQKKIGVIGRGTFSPKLASEYEALQNRVTLNRAALQKGNQSDRDMALILGETGKPGQFGGVKILDTAISRAEKNLQELSKRGQDLTEKYQGQGIPELAKTQEQKTVEQHRDVIFKGQKSVEFTNHQGQKIKIDNGNDQQMLAALGKGYAPEGYTAMLNTEGYAVLIKNEEVQNYMDKEGFTIIWGQ